MSSRVPTSDELLRILDAYQADPYGPTPAGQRSAKLGVVAAPYAGYGPARVLFDGEVVAGSRTYLTLTSLSVGDRVLLLPVGSTYVIAGALGLVDTGWLASTDWLNAAVASGPAVRRVGAQVNTRGAFAFKASGTITSSFTTLATLPAELRPPVQYLVGVTSSLPATFQGIVLPTGEIQVRTFVPGGQAYTSSSSFSIDSPWFIT